MDTVRGAVSGFDGAVVVLVSTPGHTELWDFKDKNQVTQCLLLPGARCLKISRLQKKRGGYVIV